MREQSLAEKKVLCSVFLSGQLLLPFSRGDAVHSDEALMKSKHTWAATGTGNLNWTFTNCKKIVGYVNLLLKLCG